MTLDCVSNFTVKGHFCSVLGSIINGYLAFYRFGATSVVRFSSFNKLSFNDYYNFVAIMMRNILRAISLRYDLKLY